MGEERAPLTVNEHISLALAEVHPEVSRFSYAVFGVDDRDRPDLFATCVFIECDGSPFLVTAAHAIYELRRAESALHVGGKHIVRPLGQIFSSSGDGRDPLDIAAIAVTPDFLAAHGFNLVPLSRTTLGREFPQFHFRCIHGYPCNKNRQRSRINPKTRTFTTYGMTYAGASRQPVDYAKFGKDEGIHHALTYDLAIDQQRRKVTPVNPKGMSGGGIWLVPNSFEPKTLYLDGISIEFHENVSLVFSTRIEQVVSFLRATALKVTK